jgi:Ni,Fe-hydrogenase I cytochrome b subunit
MEEKMKNRNVKSVKVNTKTRTGKILHQNNKKPTWQAVVLIVAGIIIFALIIFFAVRAYHHYTELESHRNYFRQPNAQIQDWMTVRSVVKHYNLSEDKIYAELNVSPGAFIAELGIDNSTLVDRMTIKTICVQKHLDCNAVVNKLNSIGNTGNIGTK